MTREEWLAMARSRLSAIVTHVDGINALLADIPDVAAPAPPPDPEPIPDPEPEPTPAPGARPIYYYHPMGSGASTWLDRHGAIKAYLCYQTGIDLDKNGKFDGVTSAFKSRVGNSPPDYSGVIAFDWEHAFGESGGFLKTIAGQYGAAKQQAAIAEAIKVVRAGKALRPQAKFGFYNTPFNGWSYSTLGNPPDWWWAQETTLQPLWAEVDCFLPTIYQYFEIGYGISAAEDEKRMRNYGALSLAVAKTKPIFPFVWELYHSAGKWSTSSRVIAPSQIYQHVRPFCAAAGADGAYWWGAGDGPSGTEPSLKAFRAAVDGTAL
jgi:hypothetical protein